MNSMHFRITKVFNICRSNNFENVFFSHFQSDRQLEDAIVSLWLQVKSVIGTKLQENGQELDAASEATMNNQISQLVKKESPVRSLMWKRLLAYIRLVKSNQITPPPPPGFIEVTDELQSVANAFKRITIYNYSVFGEHYGKILDGTSNSQSEADATVDAVAEPSTSSQPSTS